MLAEIGFIDPVYGAEIVHVPDKDGCFHHVRPGVPGSCQDRVYIFQALLCLFLQALREDAGFRIQSQLA